MTESTKARNTEHIAIERMYHNKVAKSYDEMNKLYRPLNLLVRKIRLLEISKICHGRVLDVGCGTGYHLIPLHCRGFYIIGADISSEMIRITKNKEKNADYVVCSASRLPFKNHAFALVLCIATLHHLPKPSTAIEEFHRVLHNGGYLYLDEPCYNFLFYFPLKLSKHGTPTEVKGFRFQELIRVLCLNNFLIKKVSSLTLTSFLSHKINNLTLAYALFKIDFFISSLMPTSITRSVRIVAQGMR